MNYYKKVSDKEMEKLVNKFIETAYNIWRKKQKKQMKQFDYWWEENATEYDVENYHKDCMRRSWRVALKLVKDKLEWGMCSGDIKYFIDWELEE